MLASIQQSSFPRLAVFKASGYLQKTMPKAKLSG